MAIQVMNMSKIGTDASNLFNITNNEGKNFITSFKGIIESLKQHWKGSDATANINDLITVYREIGYLIRDVQNFIVAVNNEEILPLINEMRSSGGGVYKCDQLAGVIAVPEISAPEATDSSSVSDEILTDADNFKDFPTKFQTFVSNLDSAKATLLNNWKSGGQWVAVENTFKKFFTSAPNYESQIAKVRDNLNTVALNKKKFI